MQMVKVPIRIFRMLVRRASTQCNLLQKAYQTHIQEKEKQFFAACKSD